jgi:hypothetical protein
MGSKLEFAENFRPLFHGERREGLVICSAAILAIDTSPLCHQLFIHEFACHDGDCSRGLPRGAAEFQEWNL